MKLIRGREDWTTYEAGQPWVTYRFGLTHDALWPIWSSSRLLGRARIEATCAVCGRTEVLTYRMPRFGPVPIPQGGRHPERLRFIGEHAHPDRGAPMSWALPLLNPEAHAGGLSLDALAMRLEADVNESRNDP